MVAAGRESAARLSPSREKQSVPKQRDMGHLTFVRADVADGLLAGPQNSPSYGSRSSRVNGMGVGDRSLGERLTSRLG